MRNSVCGRERHLQENKSERERRERERGGEESAFEIE